MGDIVNEEPVLVFLSGLGAVVNLGLVAATVLDWFPLSGEQTAAAVAFVTACCGLAVATLRAHVYSPATVADMHSTAPEFP